MSFGIEDSSCVNCGDEYMDVCVGDQSPVHKQLRCGHLLCNLCLQDLMHTCDKGFSTLSCPICYFVSDLDEVLDELSHNDNGVLCDSSSTSEATISSIVQLQAIARGFTARRAMLQKRSGDMRCLVQLQAVVRGVYTRKRVLPKRLFAQSAKSTDEEKVVPGAVALDTESSRLASAILARTFHSAIANVASTLTRVDSITDNSCKCLDKASPLRQLTGTPMSAVSDNSTDSCTNITSSCTDHHSLPHCKECLGNNPVEIVCEDCNPPLVACSACCQTLHETPCRRSHRTTLWTETYIDPVTSHSCVYHPSYYCDIFCDTCTQPVCAMCCYHGQHKNHDLISAKEAAEKHEMALRTRSKRLLQERSMAAQASADIHAFITEIRTTRVPNHANVIRTQFALAHQLLEQKEQEIQESATAMFSREIDKLTAQASILDHFTALVFSTLPQVDQVIPCASTNPTLFVNHHLDSSHQILTSLEELSTQNDLLVDSNKQVVNKCPVYMQTIVNAINATTTVEVSRTNSSRVGGVNRTVTEVTMPEMVTFQSQAPLHAKIGSYLMTSVHDSPCIITSNSDESGAAITAANTNRAVTKVPDNVFVVVPYNNCTSTGINSNSLDVLPIDAAFVCLKNFRTGMYLGRSGLKSEYYNEIGTIHRSEVWILRPSTQVKGKVTLADPNHRNQFLSTGGKRSSLVVRKRETGGDIGDFTFTLVDLYADDITTDPVGFMCTTSGLWKRCAAGQTHRYHTSCMIQDKHSFNVTGSQYLPDNHPLSGYHHNKMGQLIKTKPGFYYNHMCEYVAKVL